MNRLALVLLSLILPAQNMGSIEGLVLRAGTESRSPLVNARLELTSSATELVLRTDSSGRFTFSSLPTGRYRLRVTKDGFIRQEYPHAAMDTPGLAIDLAPGQEMRNIVFVMEPARTISGVLRDSGNAPIAGIVVKALRRGYDRRGNRTLVLAASTRTDDKGSYRIFWLDPGDYVLSATPPDAMLDQGSVSFAPTYYPGFSAVEDAKVIHLESDRDAHGLDFALARGRLGPIRGTALSLSTSRPAIATVTLVSPDDGPGVARFQTKTTESMLGDNYSIPNVPPGSYILSALAQNGETAAKRIVFRQPPSDLRANLELGAGVTIAGQLYDVPASTDLRGARISLAEIDTALPIPPEVPVAPNGTFSVPAMQPGYYSVALTGLPGDLYLKAALFSGADALGKEFAVAYGGPRELAIQLGADGGRITGAVLDAENNRFAGVHVTLIPSGNRSRLDLYRTDVSREDGSFSIRGIAPGDYKLFAWINPESNAYLNVDYMRAYEGYGIPVSIIPGENPQVSLRAITIER